MFKKFYLFLALTIAFSCHSGVESISEDALKKERAEAFNSETTVVLTDAQFRNAGIKTGSPSMQSVYTAVNVNGIVEAPPEKLRTISFPMGGYIKKTSLIPGMQVAKGAWLATVEDAAFIQLQQDYLLNKSKLQFAEADYQRQLELSKTQSSSLKIYQQAKAEWEVQKVMVKALAEKLKLIGINPDKLHETNITRSVNIYAPISAYISKVNINPGKYFSPTDILFELMDPSEVHLSLTVFERDAVNLQKGQKVIATVNGDTSKKVMATVHLITPNLDENRSVEVHCEFDKQNQHLVPGAFVNAVIQVNQAAKNAVPDEAIVRLNNSFYVFVAETERQFSICPVTTGKSTNGYTELSSPLPAKKLVLANAYALLTLLKNKAEEE